MLQKVDNSFLIYFFLKYINYFNIKTIKNIYLIYWYFKLRVYKHKLKTKFSWNYPKRFNFFLELNNIYRHGSQTKIKFYSNFKKTYSFYKKKKLKTLLNSFFLKKNLKYKNFFNYYYTKIFNPKIIKSSFSLRQRIFLSKWTFTKQIWGFLYRTPKNNFFLKTKKNNVVQNLKTKLLFFNFHKPLIWKMRTARYAHWNLRLKGKLNKYRYDKLLGKEMNYILKTKSTQFLLCIFFITYYAILSWKQLLLAMQHSLIVVNGNIVSEKIPYLKLGDIIELPYGLIYRSNKEVKSNYTKLVKIGKKIVYKYYKNRWFFKRSNHKAIPKIFKKLPVGVQQFGKMLAYDPLINVFAIVYNIKKSKHNMDVSLTKTSVLSLQNWRYNFN